MITFTLVMILSSFAQASKTDRKIERCQKEAARVIHNTIKSMVGTLEFGFEVSNQKVIGKSYDGALIVEYSTSTIINEEGHYPGSSSKAIIVVRNDCQVSKIEVDLSNTLPE